MKQKALLLMLFLIFLFFSNCIESQESDFRKMSDKDSIDIHSVKLSAYKDYPLYIDGHYKWSKQIWNWIIHKSIFEDTSIISAKMVNGLVKVEKILFGKGAIDIVVSLDSLFFEIVTLSNDCIDTNGRCRIIIGEEYQMSLFPYYKYEFDYMYHRLEPVYISGYAIWIRERYLGGGDVYISPNVEGLFYRPVKCVQQQVFDMVKYQMLP